jgi:arginase
MDNALLCLNSEWQGCENPVLESGSRQLAQDLFGMQPFVDFGRSHSAAPETADGVFALETICRRFVRVLDSLRTLSPARVVTVGGSCGIEAAPVAYLNELYEGRIGVVWFDAHADLNTPKSSPSGHFHGMVLRTLCADGPDQFVRHLRVPLSTRQVTLAGIRDLDEAERHYIRTEGIAVIPDWGPSAPDLLIHAILKSRIKALYVHIDVDVLNPKSFQDALLPVPGGPTLSELSACLQMLSSAFGIVGLGVVEFCGRVAGSGSQIARLLEDAGIRFGTR